MIAATNGKPAVWNSRVCPFMRPLRGRGLLVSPTRCCRPGLGICNPSGIGLFPSGRVFARGMRYGETDQTPCVAHPSLSLRVRDMQYLRDWVWWGALTTFQKLSKLSGGQRAVVLKSADYGLLKPHRAIHIRIGAAQTVLHANFSSRFLRL